MDAPDSPRSASTCGGSYENLSSGPTSPAQSRLEASEDAHDFELVEQRAWASNGRSLDGSQAGSAPTLDLHGVGSEAGSQGGGLRPESAGMADDRVGEVSESAGSHLPDRPNIRHVAPCFGPPSFKLKSYAGS